MSGVVHQHQSIQTDSPASAYSSSSYKSVVDKFIDTDEQVFNTEDHSNLIAAAQQKWARQYPALSQLKAESTMYAKAVINQLNFPKVEIEMHVLPVFLIYCMDDADSSSNIKDGMNLTSAMAYRRIRTASSMAGRFSSVDN